jgi:hypothetical protein
VPSNDSSRIKIMGWDFGLHDLCIWSAHDNTRRFNGSKKYSRVHNFTPGWRFHPVRRGLFAYRLWYSASDTPPRRRGTRRGHWPPLRVLKNMGRALGHSGTRGRDNWSNSHGQHRPSLPRTHGSDGD